MRQARRTSVALALIGAVTIGGAASAAVGATPRPSHGGNVTGGSSKITLSKSSLKQMKKAGLKVSAIKPAKFNGKTLSSPVKSGNVSLATETAKAVVAGGFKLSHGSKSVSISKVHSTTTTSGGSGTAVVSGAGRIAAIVTGPGTPGVSSGTITSKDFTVTLAKPLVKVLDKKFGTTLFKSHAEIGTGSATLNY